MGRVNWMERAKEVACRYRINCRELQALRYAAQPASCPVRSGRIPKPTEDEVMRRYASARQTRLEQETEAVEFAIAMVRRKKQGDLTERLLEMVYRDQTHYLKGAALELGIPERTAVRYSGYFLKNIAFAMGYISTF